MARKGGKNLQLSGKRPRPEAAAASLSSRPEDAGSTDRGCRGLDGSRLNCSFSISSLRQFVQAQSLSVRQWFRRKTFEGDPKVLLGSSSMRQEPAAERTAGCLCHGSRVRLYSPGRNRERRIHPPPDRQYRKRRLPDNLHGPD